jgi:hypothetical protein
MTRRISRPVGNIGVGPSPSTAKAIARNRSGRLRLARRRTGSARPDARRRWPTPRVRLDQLADVAPSDVHLLSETTGRRSTALKEYKVVMDRSMTGNNKAESIEKAINEHVRQGWALAHVTAYATTNVSNVYCVFVRET